jgi:hypothetical protein
LLAESALRYGTERLLILSGQKSRDKNECRAHRFEGVFRAPVGANHALPDLVEQAAEGSVHLVGRVVSAGGNLAADLADEVLADSRGIGGPAGSIGRGGNVDAIRGGAPRGRLRALGALREVWRVNAVGTVNLRWTVDLHGSVSRFRASQRISALVLVPNEKAFEFKADCDKRLSADFANASARALSKSTAAPVPFQHFPGAINQRYNARYAGYSGGLRTVRIDVTASWPSVRCSLPIRPSQGRRVEYFHHGGLATYS